MIKTVLDTNIVISSFLGREKSPNRVPLNKGT